VTTQKSRDALLFEARQTEALVQPQLIALGSQNRQHWQHIADTYRDLGLLRDNTLPADLFYEFDDVTPVNGFSTIRLMPNDCGLAGAFGAWPAAYDGTHGPSARPPLHL
jgi:hypothetical protein